MAEIERDERVTQAYRALGDEAPPAALDQAILAASRRRVGRWYLPVASAAALVFAVAIALVVEREAPKMDEVAVAPQAIAPPAREVPKQSADAELRLAESRAKAEDDAAARKAQRDALAKREARLSAEPVSGPAAREELRADLKQGAVEARSSAPAAPAPAPAPGPVAATPAPRAVAGALTGSGAGIAETPAASGTGANAETPEHWLERIAKLREAGSQKEADEALAEFRRRYPNYEIPKEMRARVERR